jgi:hypothetical protein
METREMLDESPAMETEQMPPKPLIGVRVRPEVKTALEKIAKKDDRSLAYVINKIIDEHLRAKKLIK